jgi:hypothetical protein
VRVNVAAVTVERADGTRVRFGDLLARRTVVVAVRYYG